jgi:hypothetical protein
MLFPRHPKPVVQQKAVATMVVQHKLESKAMDKHLLIIPAAKAAPPPVPQRREEN